MLVFRGRSYEDFQNHLAADPDVPVVKWILSMVVSGSPSDDLFQNQ